MGKLEKIVSSTKKHWKEIITAIALPFIFKSNVGAGTLNTRVVSPITKPYCKTQHISGATEPEEGYDNGKDVLFNDLANPPTIDIYSKIDFDPYRLKIDARPPESTSTFSLEISGRLGQLPEPQDIELKPSFSDYLGNNFFWKNIIGELYQRVDNGEGGYQYALIGNYDIKNMVNSARTIPISINNGETQGDEFFPSHKLNYYFFNYADFNRDRRVDGKDFAIWANNFGRNDPNSLGDNVGSDVNDFDAYSDIDRNGIVDINDLSTFSGEWLWDANDPNTWSRVR